MYGDCSGIPLFIGSRRRLDFPMSKLVRGATVFVEPQEFDAYAVKHGDRHTLVKMPENDRGFGYLCNQQLVEAERRGSPFWIFCDDDVLGFRRADSKERVDLPRFYGEACELMERHGLAQLMMSFQGHAWYQKEPLKRRIGAWCVIVNRTSAIRAVGGYDEQLPIFGDWDMSGTLLRCGYQTAVWNGYTFNHKMKSMAGGAADVYAKQERLTHSILMLQSKFGEETVRAVRSHGQIEARFRWSKL